MKFFNMTRVYMSPETGGDAPASGGDVPATEPVVAPVVTEPAKVEPKVEPKVEATDDTKVELTEKPVDKSKLGKVTTLVESAGLTMKEVAEYAKANDGKVDLDTLTSLTEKHGEAIAELIADQIKDIHSERVKEANDRDKSVYDQVQEAFKDITEQSGEESWKELSTWAKTNVSNDHRTEINKLLAQGGLAAKLAVQELTTAFKESQGSQDTQDADLLEADTPAPSGGGNITKQDYNMELDKLLAAGHQYGKSSEIKRLDDRRMKSMARGY